MAEPQLEAARRVLFERYRQQGAVEWIEATGTSMLPVIGDGDWVKVDFGERGAGLGEIVLFPAGGELVVHRVVKRPRAGALVTKGDNAQALDLPVQLSELLGVVRSIRRGENGAAGSAGCAGRRAVALALLSSGSASGLELARHVPRPIRHPLSRPARTISAAAIRLLAPH